MADELYPVPDDLGLGATLRGFVEGQLLFDRYVLQRVLGRGGMGVVWLAHDGQLERNVALKFLPELITLDKEAIADLKRETRHSLELTHPNIVRIYDFVQNTSWAGISMEYVDGETLSALKVDQPDGHFEAGTLGPWTRQLIEALDYAHTRARVVHRDLKPANLMINQAGELKVADFGIAKSLSDSVSRITIRGSSGTLVYMSPQQAGGRAVAASDDIYSLGATLYDLLSGKPPFYSGNIQHQLENIVPPGIAERRAELGLGGEPIPADWEETIASCLEKNPADRPESVKEVAERLGLTESPLPSKRTKPRKKPTPGSPGPKPGRTLLIVAAVVAVLILCGVGYYFGVEAPAEQARQTEIAKEAALQKEKEAEQAAADAAKAKALADQKAAEEAAAEQKAKDDAAKALADQKAAEQSAAEQKAKDDAAKALADQQAAAAAAQLAADQKAKDDAAKAKALADQQAAAALAAQTAADQKAKDDAAKAAAAALAPPWENSLGMKFLEAGTPGVLFSIYDTRLKDYTTFVEASGHDTTGGMFTYDNDGWKMRGNSWKSPGFRQGPDSPVVGVCWEDAKAFCDWLTKVERKSGKIKPTQMYRLPTDAEWSKAAGLDERPDGTPEDKNAQVPNVYPWGNQWPPPPGSGNYSDMSTKTRFPTLGTIYGYNDGYVYSSPVGSFKPNRYGLYDMGGNVWQWCEDWNNETKQWHTLRGASWTIATPTSLLTSARYNYAAPLHPSPDIGFRCVLANSSP